MLFDLRLLVLIAKKKPSFLEMALKNYEAIKTYFLAYITSLTAATTRSAFGKLAAIKVGA